MPGEDGQILFHRPLPATSRGLKSTIAIDTHFKVKDIEYDVGLTKSVASRSTCKKPAKFINSFSRF